MSLEAILIGLVIPIIVLVLGFVVKVGFENLVAKPFVDRWLVGLKPYQPFLVSAFGILVSFVSKQVGVELLPDLAPYMTASGDIVTVFAGVLMAVIAMGLHNYEEKRDRSNYVGRAG